MSRAIYCICFMWEFIVSFILRNRLLILISIFFITVFMGWQATKVQMSYELAQMLPESDPSYLEYRDFRETFGEDGNVAFIGVQDERFLKLENFYLWVEIAEEIKSIEGVTEVLSIANVPEIIRNDESRKFEFRPVLQQMPQSQQELDSLVNRLLDLKFYDGLLFNSESGAFLAAVSLDRSILNTQQRVTLINQLHETAQKFENATGIDFHYSGLPYIRTRTAEKIESELRLFVILALIIASLALLAFFRSFKVVFFSVLIVIISVIWALGLVAVLGYEITILTGILPPLLIIIGVENCIFLLNKYHQEYKLHGNQMKSLVRVVQRVGKATMLTNATTAVGFATFIITGNKILVEFGIVAALNILFVFILTLSLIPIFFSYLKPPQVKHIKHLESTFLRKAIKRVVHTVVFHRSRVYFAFSILLVIGIVGISRLHTSGSVVDDIPHRDPIYKDLLFFERNINGILPLEILVETNRPNGITHPRTLQAIDRLQDTLALFPELSRPLSIVEVMKFAKQAFYRGNPDMYELPNSHERNFIMSYLPRNEEMNDNLISSLADSTMQKTRISVQMANIGTNRIREIQEQLQPAIDSIFDAETTRVSMTGASVIFLKGSGYLIKNLLTSLIFAVIIISLLMALLFNHWRMILISLLPNLFPQLLTAALMGFAGVPIKPSTILVFSIALGISVDNSIHFLAKFKQELAFNNFNIKHAVITALRESGISMLYTFTVLFFGFSIFTASSFGGTQALGYLIAFTLLIALISNLFLMPSVLLSLHKRIIIKNFRMEEGYTNGGFPENFAGEAEPDIASREEVYELEKGK
ncbi:MAG: RND family transporter [Bacteroidetes bacterium]|nr:MAG: RND family transporter [Bacteroidota bacterium]